MIAAAVKVLRWFQFWIHFKLKIQVIVLEEKKKEAIENVGCEVEASVTESRNMSLKKAISNGLTEEIKVK